MMMSIMLVDIVGRDVMFAQPMRDHNVVANQGHGAGLPLGYKALTILWRFLLKILVEKLVTAG